MGHVVVQQERGRAYTLQGQGGCEEELSEAVVALAGGGAPCILAEVSALGHVLHQRVLALRAQVLVNHHETCSAAACPLLYGVTAETQYGRQTNVYDTRSLHAIGFSTCKNVYQA